MWVARIARHLSVGRERGALGHFLVRNGGKLSEVVCQRNRCYEEELCSQVKPSVGRRGFVVAALKSEADAPADGDLPLGLLEGANERELLRLSLI